MSLHECHIYGSMKECDNEPKINFNRFATITGFKKRKGIS